MKAYSKKTKKAGALKKTARAVLRDIPAWVLILPSLLLILLIVWRPIVMGIWMSFFDKSGETFVGLTNYRAILSDTLFIKTLMNTVSYVLWSLVIGMLPPIIVALLLNDVIHGTSFIKAALYLPTILPGIAVSLLWGFIYKADGSGLLNMLLSWVHIEPQVWLQNEKLTIPLIIISLTWKGFGFTSIMYLASLQGINRELYEAAMIDGAGPLRRTIKITLPHMYPMILLFGVNQIKSIFTIMTEPLVMTGGGPNNASLSLGLQNYRYAFQYYDMPSSYALGCVMFIILIAITIVYFRLEKKLNS